MQAALWFAGLRGAIAFALSLNLDDNGTYEVPNKPAIIATTLVIVLVTSLVRCPFLPVVCWVSFILVLLLVVGG
jgi:NhaP-type Na+/H+ or K+/H+ antiporter